MIPRLGFTMVLIYFGQMSKLMIWGIGLFYATRCSSITVAFYASAKWWRDLLWAAQPHLGRALAAPRSPGSLVLAELASLGGQIGLGDLISWTLCQLSSPLNQTPPLVLVMFFFWSPSLWGAAWSSMVDLVGCHIREVLMGCIISLAEMLGFVRLVARAGFIR